MWNLNVEQLTELLKKFPSDVKVVIRGYEDGFNDITAIKKVRVKYDPNAEWYYGEYSQDEGSNAIDAIELFGENRNQNIWHGKQSMFVKIF